MTKKSKNRWGWTEAYIVTIADLNGKTVHTMSLNDPGVPTEINHHLSPGVYLVKILTDRGAVFSEKLVVLPR